VQQANHPDHEDGDFAGSAAQRLSTALPRQSLFANFQYPWCGVETRLDWNETGELRPAGRSLRAKLFLTPPPVRRQYFAERESGAVAGVVGIWVA
jgi:hypothetical protein